MFEAFYECERTPFSREIPTSELYPSGFLEETLGRLCYAAEHQLFAVLTGDCGTGKTTTVRKLKDSLDESKFQLLYLTDSSLPPGISITACFLSLVRKVLFTAATREENYIMRLR